MPARTVPRQKRGKSVQDVATPLELLEAIRKEFRIGGWECDLAATEWNAVAKLWLGPGSPLGENSLTAVWPKYGDLWLNPPFGNIRPWAERCALYRGYARIFMLVPASVGANWYQDFVRGVALEVDLFPRVTFVGHKHAYPKDLVLAVYSRLRGGVTSWNWKGNEKGKEESHVEEQGTK